jgi:hypothetical protein
MLNWRYYNHKRKCSIGVTTITEENAQLALQQSLKSIRKCSIGVTTITKEN